MDTINIYTILTGIWVNVIFFLSLLATGTEIRLRERMEREREGERDVC